MTSAPQTLVHDPAVRRLEPIVSAIAEAVISGELGGAAADPADVAHVTENLLFKVANLPSYLRHGFVAVTHVFDKAAIAAGGRSFRRQSPADRLAFMGQWRNLPSGFAGNFLDLYEKMGIFIYYTLVEERRGLHGAATAVSEDAT